MCRNCQMNRRQFVETVGMVAAGTFLTGSVVSGMNSGGAMVDVPPFQWDPDVPMLHPGKTLKVQPVLMYRDQPFRPLASYKSWGHVNSKETAKEEENRINQEIRQMKDSSDFTVDFLPLITISTLQEAAKIHEQDYDVVLLYAATGSGDMLKACAAPNEAKDTIIFVRHRNGPIYYWYEALGDRFLKPEDDTALSGNSADNHGPLTVEDVVVDDLEEILWRLRALYALKNFIGHKTVAIGAADGKYDASAPANCQKRFKHEIVEFTYEQFAKRYNEYRNSPAIVSKAEAYTDRYLKMPNTRLETQRDFIVRAFLVYGVFNRHCSFLPPNFFFQ